MATFWEIAARSGSNLFSLYFVYLQYLFISRFGFKNGICLLIATVPVHCFSIAFTQTQYQDGMELRDRKITKDCTQPLRIRNIRALNGCALLFVKHLAL